MKKPKPKPHRARGFSLLELVISMAIVLAVTATMFELVNPAYGVFDRELERFDMHQRLRASADVLFKDLLVAGAGATVPAVAPLRRGERNADPPGSVFADRVSLTYVPRDGGPADAMTITYWLRDDRVDPPQLMRYDGQQSDLPVVDHVSSIRFDYFGAGGQAIDTRRFGDGPWIPDGVSADRYDRDLLEVRKVRVTIRVGAARIILGSPLPDQEMVIDVSPRNLNLP
jgi:prepilin-type N-terminal cleavage/methylation domain-containing protein